MLKSTPTGTWLPAWVPESTLTLSILLMLCSVIQSTTGGYDGSMMNGLNILPTYTLYFDLGPATVGLNTAAVFIGSFFGTLAAGALSDRLGRRPAVFWGAAVTVAGVVVQAAAQNVAMFVAGRVVLGLGSAVSGVASSVYLSETFPSRWRAWGAGLLNDFYYVGALIAAGVTLRTGQWDTTWAWRCPSLIQGVFSILCMAILPFVPESPRWLVHEGHFELARASVAQANSDGDASDPVAVAVYKEILDTIEWEKREGRTMSPREIVRTPAARRRLLVGASAGPFSCVAGNIIASYYLGDELKSAGIVDPNEQLKANVVLNVWCLFCALLGTHMVAQWGRKPTALVSQSLLVACLFIIGGLTKVYTDDPAGASRSLSYGAVAVMFLFQGFYSVAWTPLLYLYPPEILNYSIRANGVAFSSFMLNALACVLVYVMPIGLVNIGWRMYMVNGSWDIVIIGLIAYYWVETKGRTLEEIDALFEGEKHSSVPDVEQVRQGKEQIDVGAIERQLHADVTALKA